MKKVVGIVVALLVVIVLGGAFYTGGQAQKSMNELREMVVSNPGYGAEWTTYKKGLFSTDAVLNLSLGLGEEFTLFELPLVIQLDHGPLLVNRGFKQGMYAGTVRLSDEQSESLKQKIQAQGEGPFIESRLHMSLGGRLEIDDKSLPIQAQISDNASLSVSAYEGSGVITPDDQLTYAGALPSLTYTEDGKQMAQVDQIKMAMAGDLGRTFARNMFPGSMTLSLDSMTGLDPQGQSISLKNMSLGTQVTLNDDSTLTDFGFTLSFDEFKGAGEEIDEASFTMDFKRISVTFLEAYQKMVESSMTAGDNSGMAMMQLMGPTMEHLVPNGPIIEIKDSGFKSKDGDLFMRARIAIDPDKAKSVSNPMFLIAAVDAQAYTKVSKTLVTKWMSRSTLQQLQAQNAMSEAPLEVAELEAQARSQTEMQLNMMVIQKMLVDDGEHYVSEFTLKEGKALVNGQPMPMPF